MKSVLIEINHESIDLFEYKKKKVNYCLLVFNSKYLKNSLESQVSQIIR